MIHCSFWMLPYRLATHHLQFLVARILCEHWRNNVRFSTISPNANKGVSHIVYIRVTRNLNTEYNPTEFTHTYLCIFSSCIEFTFTRASVHFTFTILFGFQNMRSTYLSKFLEKRFSARMATYVFPEPVGK